MLPIDNLDVHPPSSQQPNVTLDHTAQPVSISLKYWHPNVECLSDWGKEDLKRLRKFIEKVQSMSWAQIKTDGGLGYQVHKGPPKGRGFSRPSALSQDQPMIEMKVTQKARVHGVGSTDTFFLVWLDRNHAVFPSGK
jgi:hypothetical protein